MVFSAEFCKGITAMIYYIIMYLLIVQLFLQNEHVDFKIKKVNGKQTRKKHVKDKTPKLIHHAPICHQIHIHISHGVSIHEQHGVHRVGIIAKHSPTTVITLYSTHHI